MAFQATLDGKRHTNVVRDIEKMLLELEVSRLKFESAYTHAWISIAINLQSVDHKQLPMVMVTGHCIGAEFCGFWYRNFPELKREI